jgi:predicted GNAT family acetyltransferase
MAKAHLDAILDEALARTFPASDPVAISVASSDDGIFEDNVAAHRFELKLANGTVLVEYEPAPGALKIVHTEVPKALEGRGLASRMAALVVAEARRRGVQLIPHCPFFAAYLKKHPEHGDLVQRP